MNARLCYVLSHKTDMYVLVKVGTRCFENGLSLWIFSALVLRLQEALRPSQQQPSTPVRFLASVWPVSSQEVSLGLTLCCCFPDSSLYLKPHNPFIPKLQTCRLPQEKPSNKDTTFLSNSGLMNLLLWVIFKSRNLYLSDQAPSVDEETPGNL